LKRWSVLIAEDEVVVAMDLEAAMEDALVGHDIRLSATIVSSVEAGLDVLDQTHFDFALVDVRLSDGDCDELLLALDAGNIPAVLYSGLHRASLEARYGARTMVLKPYVFAELKVLLLSSLDPVGSSVVTKPAVRTASVTGLERVGGTAD
jgi:CheY-like chemotaxis protein